MSGEGEGAFYGAIANRKAAFSVEIEQGCKLAAEEGGGIGEHGVEPVPELGAVAFEGFGCGF